MKKFTLLLVSIFLISLTYAQNSEKKWGLGLGGGIYSNDNIDGAGFSPEIYLSRYLGKSFDLMLKHDLGVSHKNVINTLDLSNTQLNLRYKLFNDYIIKESSVIKPYLFGGVGYLWDNNDENVNFNAGLGSKFGISQNTSLYLEGSYKSGLETTIATVAQTDNFLKLTGGIEFAFGKAKDSDGDGVPDRKDECPDTPAGVQVDEKGCPLDRDGDGIADYKDDCPDDPGPAALNGCPDKDGDGIADKDDDCPDVAGLKKFKGCPDTDEDGVPDPKDKCPDTPKGCAVDADGCPLDSDGDGIIDCEDKCPSEKGTKEDKGCPPAWSELTIGPLLFDFDKAVLKPDGMKMLDEAAEKLNSSAEYDVVIAGHTCNIGEETYNKKLSEKRAQAVVVYLTKKGINNAYVGSEGYGESNPAVPNSSIDNRKQNRRAEFTVKIKQRM